ncbi:iron chelate uptake ABC transporter family permease subunit [Glutamicibacter sp. NPDC087344]|uniref:iron chelate uptake ABC transporter family permease subunit n=1 Tax=Glutamicibacter sp. NPDC087344 TaxID=3363994 RepID=UPI0038288C2E
MTTLSSSSPTATATDTSGKPVTVRGVAANNRNRLVILICAVVLLAVVTALSIMVGARNIAFSVVWEAMTNPQEIDEHFVIRDLRIPRTIVGLGVGCALGIAGALIQALTRNPLTDPGILGVNSGAAFAVAVGVSVAGISAIEQYIWFAFIGALLATVVVYAIGSSGRGGADPLRLVLAGVALGAVLGGLTSAMTLFNPKAFDQMRGWGAGSIVGRSLDVFWPTVPFMVVGLLLAAFCARSLNSIALGDDLAKALGTQVLRTRILVIIAVTLLAGSATAVAGPIGFVGLMIPHVSRWLVGPDQRWILAYTVVLSPLLLLSADVVGRLIIPSMEIPVGILTAIVGAPVLIVLVRRRKASGL